MRAAATILTYHRVVAPMEGYPIHHPFSGLVVTKDQFEQQLKFLRTNYAVISLSELAIKLQHKEDTSNCVVLTFDDGYLDNLTLALPLLEKYQVPATVFITTGLIDRTASLWWFELEYLLAGNDRLYEQIGNYASILKSLNLVQQSEVLQSLRKNRAPFSYDHLLLTWAGVQTLAQSRFIEIGVHTKTHAVLSKLEPNALEDELRQSKVILEEKLQKPLGLFSYPYGTANEAGSREYECVEKIPFKAAVTTIAGHCTNSRLAALPRIAIDCNDSIQDVAWKLSGFYCARLRAQANG